MPARYKSPLVYIYIYLVLHFYFLLEQIIVFFLSICLYASKVPRSGSYRRDGLREDDTDDPVHGRDGFHEQRDHRLHSA